MPQATLHLGWEMIVSNVWLLRDAAGHRFLVDSGYPLERPMLRVFLWRCGIRRPGDLVALLLTHRHVDHAGNAAWVAETYACPVVAHAFDAAVLRGEESPDRLERGIGNALDEWMCRREDRAALRVPVSEAVDSRGWKFGWRVFPAFGHTEGSVLWYHEPSRTLFTGDALLSGVPPFRLLERFSLAIPAYSVDVAGCHGRLLEFLARPPAVETLCSGHGPPVCRNTAEKLRRFHQRLSSE